MSELIKPVLQRADFYVYVYFDPRVCPPEPIYVGKGKGARADFHVKRSKNKFLANKVAKIRKAGLQPIIEKRFDNLTEVEAFDH